MDSDSSMTPATSRGYLHYPPPTVYLADAHSGNHSNLANESHLVSTVYPMVYLSSQFYSSAAI